MNKKIKSSEEWFKQADYDIKSAQSMFEAGRYIYSVFLCHLSIEKMLKGIYTKSLKQMPPKTHNLIYLIEKIRLDIPDKLYDFLFELNRVSVPTRYPDDINRIMKDYNKTITKNILAKSVEVLKWLKEILKK